MIEYHIFNATLTAHRCDVPRAPPLPRLRRPSVCPGNQALGFLGLEPAAYAQFYRGALDIDGESGADEFSFNLRTRARDAVLFFCGRGSQYYLLELSRGRLMFQFMLDSRSVT